MGAAALADALTNNVTLKELLIGCNLIGDDGVVLLADALVRNTALTSINLSMNDICDDGASALAAALVQNATLTELALPMNNIQNKQNRLQIESCFNLNLETVLFVLNVVHWF